MKDEINCNANEVASSYREVEDEEGSVLSLLVDCSVNTHAEKTSVSTDKKIKIKRDEVKLEVAFGVLSIRIAYNIGYYL